VGVPPSIPHPAGRRWLAALLALAVPLALLAGWPPPAAAPNGPPTVKAAYLSYFGVADSTIRTRVLGLVERSELNAVVIDVKGDRGFIPYASAVAVAPPGARGPVQTKGFDEIVTRLKAKGIYLIARIVVFKDDVLARHHPEWAILDTRTGRPWTDNEGLAWVDPFQEQAWAYPIALAREAALKGFDEIQFDYLRFPSEGALHAIGYSRPSTGPARVQAISSFLTRARQALDGTGAALAVDVFGYAAFNSDDTGVGQRIEDLAPLVDYICPMAYPSAYHLGIPGYRNPVQHPWEVVFETVRLVRTRMAGTPARVRPWIQDFRDYAFDRREFGATEVRAQIRAAEEAGAAGWMLWNPRNDYTAAALRAR
jgi:hypothetical protein